MPETVYEFDESEYPQIKHMLEYDPYVDKSISSEALSKLADNKFSNVIFARQEYYIKDGPSLGAPAGKYYLYLKANDEFTAIAQEKFKKEFASLKRAPPEIEKKVIEDVKEEQDRANAGFGAIFGD